MAIFFTADTHFGCDRTRIKSRRPFDSVEEMDYAMISNWNRVVRKDDIVFHLGDFGNHEVIKKLNGKVSLIYGNHEQYKKDFINNPREFIEELRKMGFYSQHPSGESKLTLTNGAEIILAHKPSVAANYDYHYFTLFGHIHEFQKIKTFGYNVGVDVNNFTPVDVGTVMHYMDVIFNIADKDVFIDDIDGILEMLNN